MELCVNISLLKNFKNVLLYSFYKKFEIGNVLIFILTHITHYISI